MPPRLQHKKSRRGCQRCKARKVKCDEMQPVCAACARHGVPCIYGEPPDPPSTSTTTTVPVRPDESTDNRLGLPSPYADDDDVESLESTHGQRRHLELRLLHHYVTQITTSFPSHDDPLNDVTSIYAVDAVEMAFKFPFLMNTILALSALHKALGDSAILPPSSSAAGDDSGVDYAKAHRIYLNMATRQQCEALRSLSSTNADAVCIASILISFIALKLIPERSSSQTQYSPPLQWLSMTHGITTIIHTTMPFLPANAHVYRIMAHNDPDFRDTTLMYQPQFLIPFQPLLDFPEAASSFPDTGLTHRCYKRTLIFLGGIRHAIENNDPHRQICRRIMSFGSMIPTEFLGLMQEGRPRALVIMAHLMAMAKVVEEYWWLKGLAEREVYGIRSVLPEEWLWAMEWPVELLARLEGKT